MLGGVRVFDFPLLLMNRLSQTESAVFHLYIPFLINILIQFAKHRLEFACCTDVKGMTSEHMVEKAFFIVK